MRLSQKISIPILILALFACGRQNNKLKNFDVDNIFTSNSESDGKDSPGNENAPYSETEEGDPYLDSDDDFNERNQNKQFETTVVNPNPMRTLAALNPKGDTTRMFMKTADLKFRVENVFKATYTIEELTWKYGGFVEYTALESRIDRTTTVPVSPDSLLETVFYTVVNTMTVRVPSDKLDSLLRSFTPLVDYLDHRTVASKDIRFELLANRLASIRIKSHNDRIRSLTAGKSRDLQEVINAEENVLLAQEEADNAKIETLQLLDKVEYSTVSINIYQRQSIKRELVPNYKNIEAYQPGFAFQALQSLKSGWDGLKSVVLFLLRFWVLYVIGLIMFVAIRTIAKRYR